MERGIIGDREGCEIPRGCVNVKVGLEIKLGFGCGWAWIDFDVLS